MKNSRYIFTYGTLKRGFCNNGLIEHLIYIDEAKTIEKYQMYPCVNYAFPFVIKSEKNHQIFGEVYALESLDDLILLDELEGYPTLYLREIVKIKLSNGEIIEAIMYLKNEENHEEFIKKDEPILEWTKDISSSEIN